MSSLEQLEHPRRAPLWLAPAATTLAAWLVAFGVVTTILTLFRDELGSLPLALRALVISGVLVVLMVNVAMPVLSGVVARRVAGAPRTRSQRGQLTTRSGARAVTEHPELEALPEWPARTIAVLATVDHGPHAIPVSAPLRAGDRRILLSLHRSRGSLARLRERAQVTITVLTEGDVAFTARGRALIVQEPLAGAPDYVAVAVDVEHVDDHRQAEFRVDSGIDRRWVDEGERRALGERVAALRDLAAHSA